LDLGVDIDAFDEYFRDTPLMEAVSHNHYSVAALLLERGADVNVRNDEAETPLMVAAFDGNVRMAELLVQRGADIDARDNEGETALERAEWVVDADDMMDDRVKGCSEVVHLLRASKEERTLAALLAVATADRNPAIRVRL
jgi:hypothetical protein